MDLDTTKKWTGIISDISNILGLRHWLTPTILAGVASVIGRIVDAPSLFYWSVVAIVIVAYTASVIRALIKYKRWLHISDSENTHIVKILGCLRKINLHVKRVSQEIGESKTGLSNVENEAEHFFNNLGITLEKAIKYSSLLKKSQQEYVRKITGIDFQNKKQILGKASEADVVLIKSLFGNLEHDAEYNNLKSELYGYVAELSVSNDKVVDLINGNVQHSLVVYSGMLFYRRLIDYYNLSDDSYKRNERLIEPRFNKELEKVRKGIRTAIMKGL